ncbi:hypothetical protein LSCM1_02121 [Leishmania martiniquensis]|uniref:Uncharacterized protein n=1 Tax=Leishmania martiniquensis TaxID=1580590 RepID=A0A836FS21_9TRYP|nr:hypothetical protein LSCM1_02121 [Leishmania martiniquensis]
MLTPGKERAESRAQGMECSTPAHVGSGKLGTLSVSELRTAMQQYLRSTGALRELKTHLRGMVLTELLQQPKTARMLVHGASQSVPPSPGEGQGKLEDRKPSATGPPPIAVVSGRTDQTLQTWSCGLADALVENHLRRTRRAMSLSIFSTEAEVPPFSASGAPAEEEQYLAHLFQQVGTGAPANPEDDILTPSPSRSAKSVLQRLVEDFVARQGLSSAAASARHLHSCSTQTEASDSSVSATNPLNSLECRLAAVDAKYALTFAQLKRASGTGEQPFFLRSEVDRRLQQYKNDMHTQLRSEYEQKYKSFTRVKLQEARDEAEGRYRILVQNKTEELAEMERSVLVKLEQERQRLKMAWEDVHQQRAELDRRQRELMKEVEGYDAERHRSDAELHSWKEKARALQLQCAKWEELCGTRLMELESARCREGRRLEDIRRLQAEHAAEVQLKEEEISRLRYRLRLISREGNYSGPAAAATDLKGAAHATVMPLAQPCSATAPIDSQQLYGLLLRTEEMQRNAMVQQQHQQERWDAAWVAATAAADAHLPRTHVPAAASPSPVIEAVATTERVFADPFVSPPAPMKQAAPYPPPSSDEQAAQQSAHLSASGDKRVAAASAQIAATHSPPISAASPATSLPSSPKAQSPAPVTTSTAADPLPSSVDKPQQRSPPSKRSLSTSTSFAPPSSSASSTRAARQKPTSTPAAAAPATETSTSSSTRKSPSPSNAPSSASGTSVQPSAPQADSHSDEVRAAEARLNALAAEEQRGRGEVQSTEVSARDGITWLEGNRRELLLEKLKRARSEDSGSDSSVGGAVPPWKQFAGASLGPPFSTGATAADINFNESYSSDDAALIHDSDEDDSEF